MEFMRIDAGAVLAKAGGNLKSIRLIIGNLVIMQSMARLVPDAASYAPVTVLIDPPRIGPSGTPRTRWGNKPGRAVKG